MANNKATIDYNLYKMSFGQKLFYTIIAAIPIYFIGYLFYRSHALSAILCTLACFYPSIKTKEIIRNRKKDLNNQFKDMLYSLASSLSAGRSVESAFAETLTDLKVLYPDEDTMIVREAEYIVKKMDMNQTVEAAIMDFAKRAHIDDIDNFADVLCICKRSGGNMVDVIKNTSNIINDKIEIIEEIDTMLTQRKLERKILNTLPVLIIMILSTSAREYMEPVFSTTTGRLIMTVSVLLLIAAYFISRKIMDRKII